jgi:outer membrane protein OmpA-like peptidoglycan-associated protein
LVADTDLGGVFDGKEVARGTDPLNSKDDLPVIQIGEKIVLKGVTFEFGKATLLQSSIDTLYAVAEGLIANPEVEVEISGHTDNVGSARANISLSLRRAESVKQYLISRGIRSNRITTVGYGFAKPVTSNETEDGRSKNRRIEFVRTK